MSGDKYINIIDLTELCAHFEPDSVIGKEVHDLLETYTNKNLKVIFNPQKIEFNLA